MTEKRKKKAAGRERLDAVFTIEAAAVMIMTMLVIFSILSLSLWLRERMILSAGMKESLYCRTFPEAEQCLQGMKEKLFAGESTVVIDTFDSESRKAEGSGFMTAFGLPGGFSFSEAAERRRYPAVRFLLLCRAAESIKPGAEGKGGE